jgi:hypothetical protein
LLIYADFVLRPWAPVSATGRFAFRLFRVRVAAAAAGAVARALEALAAERRRISRNPELGEPAFKLKADGVAVKWKAR